MRTNGRFGCFPIAVAAIFCMVAATAVKAAVAPALFANVSATGTLISGNGVLSAAKIGPGQYEVTFNVNVSQCAYVATTANAYSQAIQVFTAGGHLSNNGVYVEVKNQGGGLTDGPFSLVVNCGSAAMKFAVVGYAADLVRGTAGATLTNLGVGRYQITFLEAVKTCAYIATVGDPADALVFAPGGVYTGSGSNGRSVYIETKNPGGGLSDGIPFHLVVVCPTATNLRLAVVNQTGLSTRGSALTSSFRTSIGRHTVVTNRAIANCATVATRGSIDKAVPFAPATIELLGGPATNTIGIEIRELLFFGGGLTDAAFHAATICP
jgi:hypothetical protein